MTFAVRILPVIGLVAVCCLTVLSAKTTLAQRRTTVAQGQLQTTRAAAELTLRRAREQRQKYQEALLDRSGNGDVKLDDGQSIFGQAAELFRRVTSADESDANAWLQQANCLLMAGHRKDALIVYERALEFPQNKKSANYGKAVLHAQSHEPEKAIAALRIAVESGYRQTRLRHDPVWTALADDPEFQNLARAATPANELDEYRRLDFWIGEWEVVDAESGAVVAQSWVEHSDQNGFLLGETWTDVSGAEAVRTHYYNANSKQWSQTWISLDEQFRGEGKLDEDGVLTCRGKRIRDGEILDLEVTLTLRSDGSLRLTGKKVDSDDAGADDAGADDAETVDAETVVFDYIYRQESR